MDLMKRVGRVCAKYATCANCPLNKYWDCGLTEPRHGEWELEKIAATLEEAERSRPEKSMPSA